VDIDKRPKTGGRALGTPNRITATCREQLYAIVWGEIAALPELLNQLEPRERAYILTKLLPYIVPKAEGAQTEQEPPVTIVIPTGV